MKIRILVFLALFSLGGLYSEELVTERIDVGRTGFSVLNAGYKKYYTDKYPILLDKEFREDIEVKIYDPDVRMGMHLDAPTILKTFELYGVEFTSVEGAKLSVDNSQFDLIITNTEERIERIRELLKEFREYRSKNSDLSLYIRVASSSDPFAPPRKAAKQAGDDNSE